MPWHKCKDALVLNMWHPLAALEDLSDNAIGVTTLLEQRVATGRTTDGRACAWLVEPGTPPTLPARNQLRTCERYGYLWASPGSPEHELFNIPEYEEPDRRNIHAATIGVQVSAPRAIENFLDMGHFPFVHTNLLGVEPHTEVKEYDIQISQDESEIVATDCQFFQPMAAPGSRGGADVGYVYRVPHPFCSVLYKSSVIDDERMDVIALFVQPMAEERVRAHMMLSVLDDQNEDKIIRRFQQTIFGQDKPILENQFPRRLPLDPRAETPIRADKSAISYRRWLSKMGLSYGVIAAAS